jgi:small subunit ribosomal protein S16
MAVVIRLRRTGRKNLACFRITATDSRFPRDGKTLETLGLYDPLRRDAAQQVKLDEERTRWWIEHGAVPSEIMQSIFKRLGLFPKKPHVKRDRSARKPNAATVRRQAAKKTRLAAKAERLKTRRAAKKAAAAAAPAEAKG